VLKYVGGLVLQSNENIHIYRLYLTETPDINSTCTVVVHKRVFSD